MGFKQQCPHCGKTIDVSAGGRKLTAVEPNKAAPVAPKPAKSAK